MTAAGRIEASRWHARESTSPCAPPGEDRVCLLGARGPEDLGTRGQDARETKMPVERAATFGRPQRRERQCSGVALRPVRRAAILAKLGSFGANAVPACGLAHYFGMPSFHHRSSPGACAVVGAVVRNEPNFRGRRGMWIGITGGIPAPRGRSPAAPGRRDCGNALRRHYESAYSGNHGHRVRAMGTPAEEQSCETKPIAGGRRGVTGSKGGSRPVGGRAAGRERAARGQLGSFGAEATPEGGEAGLRFKAGRGVRVGTAERRRARTLTPRRVPKPAYAEKHMPTGTTGQRA